MTRHHALHTMQISKDRVVETPLRFSPGAETDWRPHGHGPAVVLTTGGELSQEMPDSNPTAPLKAGQSCTRNDGGEHNVFNPTGHEVARVDIEWL